jgi:hypothetical protein
MTLCGRPVLRPPEFFLPCTQWRRTLAAPPAPRESRSPLLDLALYLLDPTIPDMENPPTSPSLRHRPRCPISSSRCLCLRRTSRRKRGRRLLPPLPSAEGATPPPSPKTLAQLGGVAATDLATHKRGERSSWCEPSRCRCTNIEEL